jgi:TPR repeat protein
VRPLHTTLYLGILLTLSGCLSQTYVADPAHVAVPASATTHSPAVCLAPGDSPDPFVIDWPSDRRGDLEIALKRGVVVLSLSCSSARVLPDCDAQGAYSFIGTTEREELVSLQNADEVKANLPLLAPALTAPSGVDFSHGAVVDVAIATIGRRSASRTKVSRAELKGECREATHFVRAATLGAFAMGSGPRGQSKGVAEIFAGGASGGASMAKDGSLQACRTATPDAETAVAQCGAPIRLQLKAIAEESVGSGPDKPRVEAPACPPGMMRSESGACETTSSDRSHVCAMTDIADCAQQCDHGSPTSCAILGRSYQVGRGVPLDLGRASDLLTKACTGGVSVACGRLGEMALAAHDEPKGLRLLNEACSGGWVEACRMAGAYALKHAGTGLDVGTLFGRGCHGGDPEACWSLGGIHSDGAAGVPKNDVEAARWLALSCEGGATLGCSDFAKALDAGRGMAADPARAVAILRAACDGGRPSACADLATDYFTGHAVARDRTMSLGLYVHACKLGHVGSCFLAGSQLQTGKGGPPDPALEKQMFTVACNGGVALACAALAKP